MGGVADHDLRSARRRTAARWGRATAVVLGAGLAVSLAACTDPGGPDFTPKPIETITPSAPATSASPTEAATSATPSTTPTVREGVKATGSMSIYGAVSKALKGTCQTADGGPTITMADHANDFYGKVDTLVVLSPAKKSVVAVETTFEEDSEGFTWELTYASADPVAGTSAKVSTSGTTYTISGKLQSKETRKGKTRTEILPFTIVAKCAGADW